MSGVSVMVPHALPVIPLTIPEIELLQSVLAELPVVGVKLSDVPLQITELEGILVSWGTGLTVTMVVVVGPGQPLAEGVIV